MRLISRIPPKLQKTSRFIVVGVISNGIGYGVYLLITWLGVPHKIAMTLLYCVGVTMSYLGNKKFTFADTQKISMTIVKFLVVYIIGYIVQYVILDVLVDQFMVFHAFAQLAGAIVGTIYLFIALRFFVFNTPIASTQ
ncbi:MAG: GtrA family protein [Chloroflexales bacterium]|nr:GtrA family protein [Chloroflexales bacterium]